MKFQLKLSHKGIILVSVPLIFATIFLAFLTYLLNQAEHEVEAQIRAKALVTEAGNLQKSFYDAGVAMAGYSITKSPLFADRFDAILRQIPTILESLNSLVGDNPKQQQVLVELKSIAYSALKILKEAKNAVATDEIDMAQMKARSVYKQARALTDKLKVTINDLTSDESMLVNKKSNQIDSKLQVKIFLAIGFLINIIIAVFLALFFSKGIGSRIEILTDNSIRLARGQELNALVSGNDEIAQLDKVFHAMAINLQEAMEKERAIVENAADVICSINSEGKFAAVSPACKELWGYTPDELVGRKFVDLVLNDDLAQTIQSARQVRQSKVTTSFENRTFKKDGSLVTVLWSAYWSERERSMFCVAHDITQRKLAEEAIKASEERIRTIIENMLVGLLIITPTGFVEAVNPASERIFGVPAKELLGKHVLNLFSESKFMNVDNEYDRKQFLETFFTKSLNRVGEFDAIKLLNTDEDFPVEISLTEFNIGGNLKFMANILDVSERKELEKMKKEFVATVSHELRTPLTSIRGSLTLLSVGALGVLPEAVKKVVAIAERNTIRLIGLINDILDIEKLEAGKLDMVFDDLALSNVIERSQESVKSFAEQHGVNLIMAQTDIKVHADGDRLVQVLVNLLSNACKFSPKGGNVTVAVVDIPNWVEVRVIDQGRGIPAKFKNLLFQKFQQVEASDSRKKGGTGLGLVICKGIIEQHGGIIGVESEEGHGSTFYFRIPKIKEPSEINKIFLKQA